MAEVRISPRIYGFSEIYVHAYGRLAIVIAHCRPFATSVPNHQVRCGQKWVRSTDQSICWIQPR